MTFSPLKIIILLPYVLVLLSTKILKELSPLTVSATSPIYFLSHCNLASSPTLEVTPSERWTSNDLLVAKSGGFFFFVRALCSIWHCWCHPFLPEAPCPLPGLPFSSVQGPNMSDRFCSVPSHLNFNVPCYLGL